MTADPITIPEDATAGEAVQLMLKYMISGLPILGEHKNLAGIITESDISVWWYKIGRNWKMVARMFIKGVLPAPLGPTGR